MTESLPDRDPLELLLDDFAARRKRGEPVSVAEYVARYPEYAAQIEELFPAVCQMEQFRAAEAARREAAAQHAAPAHPPQRIGDFLVVREIGRGGMGIVYEAQQQSLARRVAVKVLPNERLPRAADLERFQREAQTAARLQHTNIVPVFGVGEQDGLHYYVMPLVEGVGLDEVIGALRRRNDASRPGASAEDIGTVARRLTAAKFGGGSESARGPAPGNLWSSVARIGVQAAEALDYAHTQGTLHRDIKPGNLLVDGSGVVRVADFGLAGAASQPDGGRNGEIVGTARYMAPEQLRGAADARSDIFGLGLTLYELLTLRPLFERRDRASSADALARALRPRAVNRAIPRDLEAIVLKCLAHEPAERYQTAAALTADLRRFLDDQPVRARRVFVLERSGRWCRRNPALAIASSLVALLLVGIVVTGLAAYTQTRAALQRAQTTSHLALEMLDGVYLQLSPERVWIASDSDPAGQACACIGLRTGGSASSVERTAIQVQASRQTATLLESLLAFYDRLAEQGGDDRHVKLQSAIASRRVGDLRLCLGQIDRAEREYLKSVEKLTALGAGPAAGIEIAIELARNYNEIGNVESVRLQPEPARQFHHQALAALEPFAALAQPAEEYRYERARTLYFLASKAPGGPFGRTARQREERRAGPTHEPRRDDYWKAATAILETLVAEHARAPDCRLMLALCYRSGEAGQGRAKAIGILEQLTAEYPAVADYRYELTATYAWIPVSLFPWQGRSAVSAEGELALRKALAESQRLVAQYPAVPHYGATEALLLAKLATVCWHSRRPAEAEDLFRQAFQSQSRVVSRFSELPAHHRVLLEFLRLRWAEMCCQRAVPSTDRAVLDKPRALLEQCIETLTLLSKRPDLADDRLVFSALLIAGDTLGSLLDRIGEKEQAQLARQSGKTARNGRG